MKEKRRITSDGYFEVSKDGGKSYMKTTMKPSRQEVIEWSSMQSFAKGGTTKKGGIAEKVKTTISPTPLGESEFYNPIEPSSKSARTMNWETPQNQTYDYRAAAYPKYESPITMKGQAAPAVTRPLGEGKPVSDENLNLQDKLMVKKGTYAPTERKYGAGLETLLGAAQAGYGLQQLMKDKRPVDVIDPTFSRLTDEAVAAARYGYTPEQKAALTQDIVNTRIAEQAKINQLAGGSAGVGLANVKAALNRELMNKYKLAAEDEQLRREKMQLAAGMAGQRAGMSRALFADKMNEFMQKQQAGAELLGAGIQNVVGARRYQREREAQDQINKMIYGG